MMRGPGRGTSVDLQAAPIQSPSVSLRMPPVTPPKRQSSTHSLIHRIYKCTDAVRTDIEHVLDVHGHNDYPPLTATPAARAWFGV